jgi:hypothetical protein
MTVQQIADKLGLSYHSIYEEMKDLETLGKVVKVEHAGETMMLWLDKEPKFEYELSHNIVKMDKTICQFVGTPSDKNQIKLPMFVLRGLKEAINIHGRFDLMLEVKAVEADNIWYKIETKNR